MTSIASITLRSLAGALGAVAIVACSDEAAEERAETVRAIKYQVIEAGSFEEQRMLAGIVQAADRTALAFQIPGTVEGVFVVIGAEVEAGDLLARIDPQPWALQVTAAEGEVASAEANFRERQEFFNSQRILYEGEWIAEAAYDTARASFEGAESAVTTAEARLDMARRDLRNANLTAPFGGTISARNVEPFQEVAAGQPLFELQNDSQLEVSVLIPETIIENVSVGGQVIVDLPGQGVTGLRGEVVELGTRADTANAFPASIALLEGAETARPGMSAEVRFAFTSALDTGVVSYMVPFAALAPQAEGTLPAVFVFDRETSTVARTPVTYTGLRDNEINVIGGLRSGDIIATAGVEFLADGQRVTLYVGE